MARRVFFSFKYEDVSRAMIVRNSWVTQRRRRGLVHESPVRRAEALAQAGGRAPTA